MRTKHLVLTALFAALTAIGAFLKIQIPVEGIPAITLQFFFTAMAGVLLGAKYGAISQAVYVLLGLVGAPVFAGFSGGFSSITSPTFGFVIGLALSAPLISGRPDPERVGHRYALQKRKVVLADGARHSGGPCGALPDRHAVYGADPQPLSRQRDERVADRAGRMPAVSAGRRAEDRGLHGALPRAAQPSAEGPCGGLSQGTPCCLDFPTFSLDCQPFCGCSPLSILPYRPKPGTTVPGFCALWRNLA
mgnify:CR=1 FL=1